MHDTPSDPPGASSPDTLADASAGAGAAAYRSPLLGRSGAVPVPEGVPGVSVDSGVAWHQGNPFAEQSAAARDCVLVDRSQRPVLRIGGSERLSWLHSLTSQHLERLPAGSGAEDLVLNLKGRVQEHFVLTDRDGTLWLDTEPEHGRSLLEYLEKMVFWADVQPARADDMVSKLQASIHKIERDLQTARARGDTGTAAKLENDLASRKSFLEMAQQASSDFQ